MRIFIFCCFILNCCFFSAQTVIGTQGNSSWNSACSIDYTIGEVVIAYGSDSTTHLTQGFHQPVFEITSIETIDITFDVTIYPNPAVDQVNIIFKEINQGDKFQLYDATGKLLLNTNVSGYQMSIPFYGYSTGVYFLTFLSANNSLLKTYKIQKSH